MSMIGKKEGISPEQVEREIQHAIDSGFNNSDISIRDNWEKVPYKGESPTAKEVIEYLCKKVREQQ